MKQFAKQQIKRETRLHVAHLNHQAAEIFPLLCPTREYDWIDGWDCELVYTKSGFAELDGIFITDILKEGSPATWVVDLYAPNEKIQFCIFMEGCVIRYGISLCEQPDGTTISTWHMTITAFGPSGIHYLETQSPEVFRSRMQGIENMLNHYLETGQMLKLSGHDRP